jgi:hypothetical protein
MTFFARVSREAMTEAADQITGLLRERHHLTSAEDDDDFNVRRPEDLIQTQIATSQIMTILLASVASLSLLIGGNHEHHAGVGNPADTGTGALHNRF